MSPRAGSLPAATPPPGTPPATTQPSVSVVVPVRNRRALLRQCLDALAAQTVSDHEVIVVDDGSTDGSATEAEADAERGRRVRVLHTPGIGAVGARRLGVRASCAPVLAFTDSDCVPAPTWIGAGLAAIRSGAAVAAGPTWPTRRAAPLERTLASDGRDGLYATCNVFYDRASYEHAGGFDPTAGAQLGFRPGRTLRGTGFGEDTLLAWRVVRGGGRAEHCPDAVVHHHVFSGDAADSARRAWSAGAFPALVRAVPELRATFLVDRYFLGTRTRLGLYAAIAAALLGRRRAATLALAAWALPHARRAASTETSRRRALWSVPADLAVDAVTGAALVAGSARHRTVVL